MYKKLSIFFLFLLIYSCVDAQKKIQLAISLDSANVCVKLNDKLILNEMLVNSDVLGVSKSISLEKLNRKENIIEVSIDGKYFYKL